MASKNRAEQIRLDRHLGIEQAARGAGVATRTLRKLEKGDPVQARVLARLSTFYAVPASELLMPPVVTPISTPTEEAAA